MFLYGNKLCELYFAVSKFPRKREDLYDVSFFADTGVATYLYEQAL